MPTRVNLVYRIIGIVTIKVEGFRTSHFPTVCILCQEPSCLRAVISCIQIILPRHPVIDPTGIADFVLQLNWYIVPLFSSLIVYVITDELQIAFMHLNPAPFFI